MSEVAERLDGKAGILGSLAGSGRINSKRPIQTIRKFAVCNGQATASDRTPLGQYGSGLKRSTLADRAPGLAACKTRHEMKGAEVAYPDIQTDNSKRERSI